MALNTFNSKESDFVVRKHGSVRWQSCELLLDEKTLILYFLHVMIILLLFVVIINTHFVLFRNV
jgi:hypothetical protein